MSSFDDEFDPSLMDDVEEEEQILYYLIFSYLFIRIDNFMFYKNIYINYFLGTPKHPETVCRNWPVPKYSVPLNKPKQAPKRY